MPSALLVINGTKDELFNLDGVRACFAKLQACYRKAGIPDKFRGSFYDTPHEFKRYDIQDGIGINFLKRAGIRVAFVTGRVSESVRLRARELEIEDVFQDDGAHKLPAFLGDDFPDLPVLKIVGLPVAVANATQDIRAVCALRLSRAGGHGAVREFAELLLKARGEWKAVSDAYVAERSLPSTRV